MPRDEQMIGSVLLSAWVLALLVVVAVADDVDEVGADEVVHYMPSSIISYGCVNAWEPHIAKLRHLRADAREIGSKRAPLKF